MSESQVGLVFIPAGGVVTVAGAAMYVLPGPGLPVLLLGLALLAAGAVVRVVGKRRG